MKAPLVASLCCFVASSLMYAFNSKTHNGRYSLFSKDLGNGLTTNSFGFTGPRTFLENLLMEIPFFLAVCGIGLFFIACLRADK